MRPDRPVPASRVLSSVLLAAALSAALLAEPAAAVDWEVTPQVSYRSGDYELEQGIACLAIYTDCVLRGEPDAGAALGVILGVGVRPGWQLELLANRQETDLDARARLVPVGPGVPELVFTEHLDFEVAHLQIGASRAFGEGTVHPFVGGAVGVSRVELDAEEPDPRELALRVYLVEDRSEAAFSASAGAGVKIHLSERLGLRLEGRAWWVDLAEEAGGDFTQLDASAGLVLRF